MNIFGFFKFIIITSLVFFCNSSFAAPCIDNDGDGWGWDGQRSCIVEDEEELPSNATMTTLSPNVTMTTLRPLGSSCVDSDGDGWGWDGTKSCQVGVIPSNVSSSSSLFVPLSSSSSTSSTCVDNDGDGWGWDGTKSCQVGVIPSNVSSSSSLFVPLSSSSSTSSTCVDDDGDGWGWDGTKSCQVGVNPSNVSSSSSLIAPVSSSSSSSGLAPAAEAPSITSCPKKEAGVVLTSSMIPNYSEGKVIECTGPGAPEVGNNFAQYGHNLHIGSFLISSNPWHYRASSYEDWFQCIKAEGAGDVKIAWDYDWGPEDSLQPGFMEWDIKGFPEIIYGVKSGDVSSGGCETTGLPVTVNDMPQIRIYYSYDAPIEQVHQGDAGDEAAPLDEVGPNGEPPRRVSITGGDRNVAFESFFHETCDIKRGTDENKEFEIMVWVESGPERRPSGPSDLQEDTFTDASGNVYEVWSKKSDPDYIGYVAKKPIKTSQLNWNEFIDDVAENSEKYGAKAFNKDWCMANILFGTEIWWGKGSFNLKDYKIFTRY